VWEGRKSSAETVRREGSEEWEWERRRRRREEGGVMVVVGRLGGGSTVGITPGECKSPQQPLPVHRIGHMQARHETKNSKTEDVHR